MAVFVVDSNFFIQAHRVSYPLDIAKGFWHKVHLLALQGSIISIDKVWGEISKGNDELKNWCETYLPTGFFRNTDEVMSEYGQVVTWAVSKSDHYLPKALNEFLGEDEADAFIVAYCLAEVRSRILITYENSEPKRRSKIKIPDCCNAMGVEHKVPIEMFRQLRETF